MLGRIFGRGESRAKKIEGEHPSKSGGWWADGSDLGADINERNALTLSTVWGCVNAISDDISKLPLQVRQKDGKRRIMRDDHPVSRFFNTRPNPEMYAKALRECVLGHCLTWGNGYVEIIRNGMGEVTELWPIPPHWVHPERVAGKLRYRVTAPKRTVMFAPEEIMHVHGLGYDGVMGYSVIAMARKSMAMTANAEDFGSYFFKNAARPSGVLTHPKALTDKGMDRVRDSWNKTYGGVKNTGRPLILEEDMKWLTITIPPEDAQFLQTRQFQVPEICRWFRVPPTKVGDLTKSTYSNQEQGSRDYVTDSLLGWAVRFEQECDWKLFGPREIAAGLYTRHNFGMLLRGDAKSRSEAYASGRQWGYYSANDIRELEDLDPLPDGQGDEYLRPVNMTLAGSPPTPTPASPGAPEPEPKKDPAPIGDPDDDDPPKAE